MTKIDIYKKIVTDYKIKIDERYGQYCGFAIDGPINPEKWFCANNNLKILFLLKEAYGYDEDEFYKIMEFPEGYNAAKTNRKITRLSFALNKVYKSFKDSATSFISDNELFNLIDPIFDEMQSASIHDLKNSYLDIAIIEIKKISGGSKSTNSDIRKHSKENSDFLTTQIKFLEPNIIICGGPITWTSLTQDLKVFNKGSFPTDSPGTFKKDGIIVYNRYHPSFNGFDTYSCIFDILKSTFL
jgi:hypothetical protein